MKTTTAETPDLIIASDLKASTETVWQAVSRMSGVNRELMPWLYMTAPRWARDAGLEDAPLGETAFVSWLLALGFLPCDRHRLCLERVDVGRRFVEESTSWTQKRWRHERTLEPLPDNGCRVTDRLTFSPRLPFAKPLLTGVIRRLFAHRHRKLIHQFGIKSKT